MYSVQSVNDSTYADFANSNILSEEAHVLTHAQVFNL